MEIGETTYTYAREMRSSNRCDLFKAPYSQRERTTTPHKERTGLVLTSRNSVKTRESEASSVRTFLKAIYRLGGRATFGVCLSLTILYLLCRWLHGLLAQRAHVTCLLDWSFGRLASREQRECYCTRTKYGF